jgi:membrane protease YdiL (CAAX protease family)
VPATAPLDLTAQLAVGALLATVVALWLRPWWPWLAAMAATLVAGAGAGILDGAALFAFLLLAGALERMRGATGLLRATYGVMAAIVWVLLALHAWPGFHNPVIIREAVLSPGAIPYTQYANADKGLAGVLLLGVLGLARSGSPRGWPVVRDGLTIGGVALVVVMAASLSLGFVRFEPRWTSLFWVWAPINLLLTCVSEEAFFRGFLQREIDRALEGRPYAAPVAVAVSAVLFGLAHAAGGWRYVLLATVAGAGYALAWQRTGRVEAAVLTHFAVNATHFLLFTYPALA